MKKSYISPSVDTNLLYLAECYLSTVSMTGGAGHAPGGFGAAKERNQDEDDEAYTATDGASQADYGDLW